MGLIPSICNVLKKKSVQTQIIFLVETIITNNFISPEVSVPLSLEEISGSTHCMWSTR